MRFIEEGDVERMLTMPDAIAAVESAFRLLADARAVNRPRQRVRTKGLVLHVMPAGSDALGVVGLKAYTTGPKGAQFYFMQFDPGTGELLALIEADRLGQIRTGAASGVATRHMARDDATRVGIYGTGWQARSQLDAVASVRPVESVVAYGRNRERRERFCREMSERLGIAVEPAEAPEAVPRKADIVITATSSKEPVLRGAWLEPGQHVNAIGSNALGRCEIDEKAVTRASFIAADSVEQAKIECGDLGAVIDRGKLTWERVEELAEVVSGKIPARRSDEDITLFESQGLAIEDVAVAKLIYDSGAGKEWGR